MGQIKFTTEELERVIDGRYNSFRQDIGDSVHVAGNPQIVSANTEYRYTNDGNARNSVTAPTYLTDRWDAASNKIAFPTEMDSPSYVADIGFTFDPDTAATGTVTLRAYIDDASPKLIRTISTPYKGSASIEGFLVTWYLGTDAGYDAKNDGVYFTLEFSGAGSLYNKGAVIYRT